MSKKLFIVALATALFLFAPRMSVAADISCVNGQGLSACSQLWISGAIEDGDAQKFETALRRAGALVRGVALSSPGGSPRAAMQIGKLVRARNLATRAPSTVAGHHSLTQGRELCSGEECTCASACFFIWAAGAARTGDRLGIHRPYHEFSGGQPDNAGAVYWRAKLSPRLLALTGVVRDYLTELDVPQDIIDRITRARTSDMHWLSAGEAQKLSIAEIPQS